MKKKNEKTTTMRVPKAFKNEYMDALDERFRKRLITRNDWNSAGGFKLVKRMPEWKRILVKLKTIPKKEDIL